MTRRTANKLILRKIFISKELEKLQPDHARMEANANPLIDNNYFIYRINS